MAEHWIARYALATINFVTLLAGLAVFTLGVYGTAQGASVRDIVPIGYPLWVLVTGSAIVLTSLVGLYSALSRNYSTLRVYLGLMLGLLILHTILSTLSLAKMGQVEFSLNDAWDRAFKRDYPLLEKLEKAYGCCGFASPYDRAVPKDCAEQREFGFVRGCKDRLATPVREALRTSGRWGLLLAGVVALGLVLTVAMFADVLSGDGADRWWESDSERLAEARHLLREGNLPAHQRS